jgi:uncharacterized protein
VKLPEKAMAPSDRPSGRPSDRPSDVVRPAEPTAATRATGQKIGQTAGQSAGQTVGAFTANLITPTVRLGVTGLSRAGKTVFITALVRNLIAGGRLPFFHAAASGRIIRAYLEPQPDDAVPRFAYEAHLAALSATEPTWPEGTRQISQLRVTIEYEPTSRLRRMIGSTLGAALGPALGPTLGPALGLGGHVHRLHVDIIDYPGEWLIDLALLDQSFEVWSAQALAAAQAPQRADAAHDFLAFTAGLLSNAALLSEPTALDGAALYTAYLAETRRREPALSTLSPGRFLMPGDLAGSPLLTFFPLDTEGAVRHPQLAALLARRFESYKTKVVKPFFRDHFARLDRQIVLMDALAAINAGPEGLSDLSRAMTAVLAPFKPGLNTWLWSLFRRRVDRLMFAATKADHLPYTSHDRLEALLRALSEQAIQRAEFAGAEVRVLALSALRATRDADVTSGHETLACIAGTPLTGEHVGATVFDGRTETVLFPGDLPADPAAYFRASDADADSRHADIRSLRFAPPRLVLATPDGRTPPLPHIRLDRAIEFLIGDKLS